MKGFIKSSFLVLIVFLFSFNVVADKVYSSGSTITAKTYKERGYVSRIQNPFFDQIASLGMVTDVSVDVVYGENPSISDATPDIWDGDGLYNYSADATADILSIASSSASDTQVITILGLDLTGDVVNQTATLNGTTRVALSTGLWRVLDAENDTSTDTVGNIFVYTGRSTVPTLLDTTIRAVILIGKNKSYMALRTIPNDKVGFLTKFSSGLSSQDGTGNLETILYFRKHGKIFKILDRANLASPSSLNHEEQTMIPIPGMSDIRYSVADSSTDTAGVTAGFELMIFDESTIDTDFLSAIGQPGY